MKTFSFYYCRVWTWFRFPPSLVYCVLQHAQGIIKELCGHFIYPKITLSLDIIHGGVVRSLHTFILKSGTKYAWLARHSRREEKQCDIMEVIHNNLWRMGDSSCHADIYFLYDLSYYGHIICVISKKSIIYHWKLLLPSWVLKKSMIKQILSRRKHNCLVLLLARLVNVSLGPGSIPVWAIRADLAQLFIHPFKLVSN